MGETGMLIDSSGAAVAPAFAWFDPRGVETIAGFPAAVREEFAGRTGLPLQRLYKHPRCDFRRCPLTPESTRGSSCETNV